MFLSVTFTDCIYLFIYCGLFQYTTSNGRMISKLWIGKYVQGSDSRIFLRYYPKICLYVLKCAKYIFMYGIRTLRSRDACVTLLSGDILNGESRVVFFKWVMLLLLFISEWKYTNKPKISKKLGRYFWLNPLNCNGYLMKQRV